jgi:hypothetical protein
MKQFKLLSLGMLAFFMLKLTLVDLSLYLVRTNSIWGYILSGKRAGIPVGLNRNETDGRHVRVPSRSPQRPLEFECRDLCYGSS